MITIRIKYEPNNASAFVHLVNYMLSREVISMEHAIVLAKRYNSSEGVAITIPDEMVSEFKKKMDALGFLYSQGGPG